MRQRYPTPELCARPNFQKKLRQSCVRGPTFKKGCGRSSRRLQLARHAHNNASHLGIKNALWATRCSHAALRNATTIVIVATATILSHPARETTTTTAITLFQCNSNNNNSNSNSSDNNRGRGLRCAASRPTRSSVAGSRLSVSVGKVVIAWAVHGQGGAKCCDRPGGPRTGGRNVAKSWAVRGQEGHETQFSKVVQKVGIPLFGALVLYIFCSTFQRWCWLSQLRGPRASQAVH